MSDTIGVETPHYDGEKFAALKSFFAEICSTGERKSAERIWEACEALSRARATKITIAAVGDYCGSKFGGPRGQSIKNKPHTLAELVRQWNAIVARPARQDGRRARATDFLLNRADPQLRAYFSLLEYQLKEERAKSRRLTQAIEKLSPLQIGSAVIQGSIGVKPEASGSFPSIDEVERDSIRAFLNHRHLESFELRIDKRGRLAEGSRVLAERPVLDLLRKLSQSG